MKSNDCFAKYPIGTMFEVLQGRSFVEDVSLVSVAALLYPQSMVIGDTYNFDPNNFRYYGRNLQQLA